MELLVNEKHSFQTSHLTSEQAMIISIMRAYSEKSDLKEFLMDIYMNFLTTSVSVGGLRNDQLQNIAVGRLSESFQLELARARNPANNNVQDELRNAI